MKMSVVNKFMEEHSDFFRGNLIVRGLYIRIDCEEIFVLEQEEWKNNRNTFVFRFNCGHLVSCTTEINTMEHYILEIPHSDFAEYVDF